MPSSSRFPSLPAAQKALTELYVAFGPRERRGKVDAVRIQRSNWQSVVVEDRIGSYEAMSSGLLFRQREADLDSIFYVSSLNYHWNRKSTVDASKVPLAADVASRRR